MTRDWKHLLSALLSSLLIGVCVPAVCGGQTISGRVLEEGSSRPVAGAAVSLVDHRGRPSVQILADSVGRFVLAPRQAGEYRLVAERLGYVPTTSPLLALQLEGHVDLDLIMDPEPIGIAGLEVSTKSEAVRMLRSYGHTPDDLGPRWIDRERIEKVRTALRLADVIRWQAIPGVRVRVGSGNPSMEALCVESLRRGHPGCALTILNGVVIDPVEINQIDPSMVESIAVLSSTDAATLFGTRGGNGAVLVWLRAGGR